MMHEIFWRELNQTKFNEGFISYFLDRKKYIRKMYLILTLVFSTGGILGWKIWEAVPALFCALVAVVQIFGLIQEKVVLGDTELNDLSNLRRRCIEKFNELENLWLMYKSKELEMPEVQRRFYHIRSSFIDIETLEDKLHIREKSTAYKKAEEKTRDYFKNCHLVE